MGQMMEVSRYENRNWETEEERDGKALDTIVHIPIASRVHSSNHFASLHACTDIVTDIE